MYQGADKDYCSFFSVIFRAASKSVIICVRLILVKKGLTDLPDQDGKSTSDTNLVLTSHERS